MRKISFFLSLLLTFAGVTNAKAQSWFIDRTGWTVTAQNFTPLGQEGGASGPAAAMIDGNEASYWHSDWTGAQPGKDLPQSFMVDLGEEMDLGGFAYLPRPENGNGTISAYKVFVSNTAYDVTASGFEIPTTTPAMEGTFTYGSERVWKYATSASTLHGRYVLVVSTASKSGTYATCAEFQVFTPAVIGKTDAQIELNTQAARAEATVSTTLAQAGMPGYPDAEDPAVTGLSDAITAAYTAANSGTGMTEASTALTTALTSYGSATATLSYPTDVYFAIVNSRAAISYDPTKSGEVDAQNGNAEYLQECLSVDYSNPNHLWSFYQNPENGEYYLYNVGKKLFANSGGHGTYGDTWIFSKNPCPITMTLLTAPEIHIQGNGKTMSVSTSYTGPIITYYADGDGGVPFTFSKSNMTVDATVTSEIAELVATYNAFGEELTNLENAIGRANAYINDGRLGNGLNQYSQPADDEDLATAVTEANSFRNNISSDNTVDEITTWVSKINTLVDHLTINMPEPGKFYSIRCAGSGMKRITSDEDSNDNRLVMAEGVQTTNTYFYYNDNHLLSYVKGLYVNDRVFAAMGNTGANIEFSDGASVKIGTYFVNLGGNRFFFGEKSTLDAGNFNDAPNIPNAVGYTWWLEPVNALPITIGSTCFATLWAPVALTVPENVTAYTATLNDAKDALILEDVGEVIPANTGVVLKATVADDYNFTITTTAEVKSTSLTGQVNTIAYNSDTDGKVYTLQTVEDESYAVGFKAYNGTKLSGFKARLEGDDIMTTLRFIFDATTGIDGITTEAGNANTIFDVSGRRVAVPAKGVYIVNGKKVIFK